MCHTIYELLIVHKVWNSKSCIALSFVSSVFLYRTVNISKQWNEQTCTNFVTHYRFYFFKSSRQQKTSLLTIFTSSDTQLHRDGVPAGNKMCSEGAKRSHELCINPKNGLLFNDIFLLTKLSIFF